MLHQGVPGVDQRMYAVIRNLLDEIPENPHKELIVDLHYLEIPGIDQQAVVEPLVVPKNASISVQGQHLAPGIIPSDGRSFFLTLQVKV